MVIVIVLLIILPWGLYELLKGDEEIRIQGDATKIRLLNHQTGEVLQLGLEEYIAGVVAAEMPASFPLEALKAQAVAARTYAVKRLQVPDPRLQKGLQQADVSSDPAINQAWISNEEMKARWGIWHHQTYRDKVVRAVVETRGQVLVYQGQLIDPVYHSSCGGKGTENSEDVWKYAIPYLRRVECGGHPSGNKEDVVELTLERLDSLLGTSLHSLPAAKLNNAGGLLSVKEKSAAGRVKTLAVGGKNFTGAELRSKLGLKSTYLTWQVEAGKVCFNTTGYGHAVGMCQYGAGAMAEKGAAYRDILYHYYTGVSLAQVK